MANIVLTCRCFALFFGGRGLGREGGVKREHESGRGRRLLAAAAWLAVVLVPVTSTAGETTVPMQPAGGVVAGAVEARQAALDGDRDRTRFRVTLSKGVTAEVFTLASPYRVVVDLPGVSFSLDDGTGQSGLGLVSGFRYGQFAEGKARIVLDTDGPVRIDKAAMTPAPGGAGDLELMIEVVPVTADSFGAGTGAGRPPPPRVATAAAGILKEPAPAPAPGGKPVIVIDPGHGGIDGGTVGIDGKPEKTVVLAVAKQVAEQLNKSGRYAVKLTRTTDVFIPLDQRLAFSRSAGASLFISLHADSLADSQYAPNIRGATVYTLSAKASNEVARRRAEKENASDLLAGIDVSSDSEADDIKGILIDLMKRETSNFSTVFSNILTGRLGKSIALSSDPQKSAAFKVLKQTGAPSVLIELGYMSHPEDHKLLHSAAWQRRTAAAIAEAADAYFARRAAKAP